MIKTKDLFFQYSDTTKFTFPDIECGAGETLLVTGQSGCGKTTFLHLLGGLLKPQSGSIVIDRTQITPLSGKALDKFRGQNIGIVLQEAHFIPSLNVLQNLLLPVKLTSSSSKANPTELLTKLGLDQLASRHPKHLSSGQRQRVSIAQAVGKRPLVLLADEPTSGLDDTNAENVADLLVSLSQEYKTALVIVTHDHRLRNRFTNHITL